MPRPTDVRPIAASLYLLPVRTRMPLKFGPETLTEVTCARVKLTVEDRRGRRAVGWGETPLSVQWAWPSHLSYRERHETMVGFCRARPRRGRRGSMDSATRSPSAITCSKGSFRLCIDPFRRRRRPTMTPCRGWRR